MYELSRVRLHAIGPPGARFADVTLDFSGVGDEVTGPRQDALFTTVPTQGSTTGSGPAPVAGAAPRSAAAGAEGVWPRRPSPASVLFLENGGGKSVLIKLIFSVVLPGRRQVVGTSNGRVLDSFVLPGDTGHVVCEWQHAVTGRRLLTGKVSEWRGRGANAGRPTEAWYSLRPTSEADDGRASGASGMGIDRLPFTEAGRHVTLSGFRTRLQDAHTLEPALELAWVTQQGAWSEQLDTLGLDPELFRYQRAMNAGEGEAAEAFSFGSDEQFVEFLLRAVTATEDPDGLADVVDGYAARLAQRAVLSAERDFVQGALERLAPLVTAVAQRTAAARVHAGAAARTSDLHDRLRARLRRDEATRAGLDAQLDAARGAERDAAQARARAHGEVLALRRRSVELRVDDAIGERDRLAAAVADAGTEIDAWRAVEDVLRLEAASAEATRLTLLATDAEGAAATALADRDAAARDLLRGLRHLAEAADDAARAAQRDGAEHEQRARAAEHSARRAADDAATARAREQALREQSATARDALATAVRDGLVNPGGTDPAAQARQAAAEAEQARVAVRDALSAAARAQDRTAVEAERRDAERALTLAENTLDQLRTQVSAADTGAAALLADGRIAALLGPDDDPANGDPADGGTLGAASTLAALAEAAARQLAAAIRSAEARQLELSVAADRDRRLLGALGGDGLRPARAEVTATVEALRDAGIAAVAGWTRLAHTVPAGERDRIVRARPHLVDGVVVTDRTGLARVGEALAEAALLPDTLVAVGLAEDLTTAATGQDPVVDGERVVLVRPNPALFDPAAAATERERIRARQDERTEQAAATLARITADRDLAVALAAWLRAWPPGQPARLATEVSTARDAVDAARTRLAHAHDAVAQAERGARDALEDVEPLRAAAEAATARAGALDRLARTVGEPAGLEREATRAAAIAEDALAAARAAQEHAGVARRAAAQAVRRADEAHRNAAAARAEAAGVLGAAAADPADPAISSPAPAVAVLRVAYEATSRTYAQVAVGADLRGELDRARREEAALRGTLDAVGATVRTRASALLAGVSGGDGAARLAGETRARETAATLGAELDDARERLGALREELRTATETARRFGAAPLAAGRVPASQAEAAELLHAATSAVDRAEAAHAQARAGAEALLEGSARIVEELTALEAVTENLADLPATRTPDQGGDTAAAPAVPFDGDAGDAREQARALRAAWRDSAAAHGRAAADVRTAAEAVTAWAAQDEFDQVSAPARRQMTRAGQETVADHAAAWSAALEPRLRSLSDDLAHIGRNREAIVARLEGMVRAALGTLRAAGRLSRLPERLGDWSGQEFLRVTFAEPDDRELTEALGRVVDETAAATGARRDGMALLLRGVRAAQPRGVRVEILKPDAVLRTERVRVSDLGDVFSGGQQLTTAIILYCTMAALRANDRGQVRAAHAGVLFLDNPIGRASAGYLLDLQLAVADRLGVQLVYTTGLFDTAALSAFPLIVRLRNDADLRAGRKYLRVTERLRPGLIAAPPAAATPLGTVTATRLYTRPLPTPTQHTLAMPPSLAGVSTMAVESQGEAP
ncbi:hypothetical protein MXD61_12055 [Frankia sp. AgPm24]|uniref:hypothetical protein n=1 Tax=Frankia sp. AgPm24 TaxID=631128 RepID=UPI00200C468F|nr:hypothetical protein [Frankia sp. AgPm24]MCK9922601.1 hypothetical protein [Frankia sp. AgPm24]